MKKIISIIALVLIAATICCVFVACDDKDGKGGKGDQITLNVWGAEKDQAMLKDMCKAYADANPDKNFKFLFGIQGENDAADKVLNDPDSGPDVFSFASDQINKLLQGGALARIGGEIETNIKQVNNADSVDAATVKIGGEDQLYAYPVTGDNTYFLYYDKRVLSDQDIQTLDGIMARATEVGKDVHFKLNDDGWYLSSFFFADENLKYEVTYDENMQEQAISINYNTPAGLNALKSAVGYVQNSRLVVTTDDGKMVSAISEDTACAVVSGTWNAEAIRTVWGDNMGVAKLPTATINGEQKQLVSYFGYKLMGVNGFSKNKGEAHKLAQWLTNEQNQILRYRTRGFAPTNINAANIDEIKNDAVLKAVFAQQEFARTQKGVPSTYWTPMKSLLTPMLTMAPADITDAYLQAQLDSIVDQISK